MKRLYKWITSPQHLIGVSLLRILLGIIIMYSYIVNYPMRHFFWSNEGMIDNASYIELNRIPFSVYGLSNEMIIFELTYHAGFLLALLFTLGTGGKAVQILNYVFTFSLINRNGFISDGGDNLLYLTLIYMLLMNTTAHFSLKIKEFAFTKRLKQSFNEQLAIIHNFGLIFIVAQLSMMYLLSGLYQVMGERWTSGTAIYYIMQVEQYSIGVIPEFLLNNSLFIVAATYASILVKIAFPFALFNRYTKYIVLIGIIGFHVGIGVQMGLVTFSAIMIAVDTILITDKEYKFAYHKVSNKLSRFNQKRHIESPIERKSA